VEASTAAYSSSQTTATPATTIDSSSTVDSTFSPNGRPTSVPSPRMPAPSAAGQARSATLIIIDLAEPADQKRTEEASRSSPTAWKYSCCVKPPIPAMMLLGTDWIVVLIVCTALLKNCRA
jgi:hypothetical protein